MGSNDLRRAIRTAKARGDVRAPFGKADAFRVESHVDAFLLQDVLHSIRNILVFVVDEAWTHFHDGDFAAESAEHLPELQPNVTSPGDQQVPWKKIDFHHRGV